MTAQTKQIHFSLIKFICSENSPKVSGPGSSTTMDMYVDVGQRIGLIYTIFEKCIIFSIFISIIKCTGLEF